MQNTNSLEAKVVLITGAARRVGAEIARTLHAAGMNVVLHFNTSEEDAIKLCEELNQIRKLSAVAMRADLTDSLHGKTLIENAAKVWNRLDALVNNASRYYRTMIGKVTEYAWDDLMNSNVKAPFFLAQIALPHLTATKGCIINITDVNGVRPQKDYSVYCISKAALIMTTKILAKELGPVIRVNAVSPGVVAWPEGENCLSVEEKQKIIGQTVLERSGDARDIASAVLFLIRDATYVSGEVLNVDGGRLLCG